ncbi:endonuclease/exonuclease/phosphatase family protein [Aspergillus novofumigatus IBT 16806]|uniref:Endonuclease/exonuclease/phosphatase family protein n=1 Tax=Aspergillus novofumigatus (strain IBT 16806) TaxID=1392255 RepID=A0A2I1CNH0_ASPN1|nr:endonuclease/exonuclease/phosphatase family protein [Aspergillus novofumigatus IBT 16806]PKX99174.1 endonuclease/exonuclease/phosphatase family protein [Aspergillus novofumigatus IBT 16806]
MTSKLISRLAKKLPTAKSTMRLDRANPQPFYHYFDNTWTPIRSLTDITGSPNSSDLHQTHRKTITRIRLTTWNIDFQTPLGRERMAAALEYLSHQHSTQPDDETPSSIFLQEMAESDLQLIQESGWIQEKFFITDTSSDHWRGSYGTTTMIDKQLVVRGVFRVPYSNSRMKRDGLFVDVDVGPFGAESERILRLCNTHLESLVSHPPRRPVQLRLASIFMHGSGPATGPEDEGTYTPPTPHAAILAGDLNAFAPEDRSAPEECGLRDAFLTLGGREGTEESFTWGQQVPDWMRERFGCSRMDKILYCGGVEAKRVTVTVTFNQSEREDEEVWVTDHLGLQGEFVILSSSY